MSSVNFTTVRHLFTNKRVALTFLFLLGVTPLAKAWDVDMSRRKSDFQRIEDQNRMPASETEDTNLLSGITGFESPTQDIVILNTESGFVPEKVYLARGQKYSFHIVNVNEKNRNVSFMLDAFGENHNTVFGVNKSFEVKTKKEGVFTFLCPETTFQGKVIVVDKDRKPAGE